MKQNKQSNGKKVSKLSDRRSDALDMVKEMKVLEKKQDKILNAWDKATQSNRQSGRRSIVDNFYSKQSKEIENKQDALYSKYYGHMNKDFKRTDIEKNMLNYKEGFIDKKFINDMYNNKMKAAKDKKKVK